MLFLAIPSVGAEAASPTTGATSTEQALFSTVSKLDIDFFNAFNHCASPAQLEKHASYLVPNLEFYHDKGGVTWSRQDYLANTRNNVCGQFRRKLIAGSLQVFPVKDYGAIEQGKQKFCWLKSGKCFGEAQFLILWHHLDNRWEVTRVFSYGHLPIE
ncbi:MAG: DUF4440 domain-containing protein [Rhodanobacter sp.]